MLKYRLAGICPSGMCNREGKVWRTPLVVSYKHCVFLRDQVGGNVWIEAVR